jgi:predicted  nucleic acid-binding Zn-ribbon protein
MDLQQALELAAPFLTGAAGAVLGLKTRLSQLEASNKQQKKRLADVEAELEEVKTASEAFEKQQREERQEWQQAITDFNRTLGQIEGFLEAQGRQTPQRPQSRPEWRPQNPQLPPRSRR